MPKEKVTFKKWELAGHLKSAKDIRAYLEVAAENNDPREFARALGDVVNARNVDKIGRKVKMTRKQLSKTLSSDGNPHLDIVVKVVSALGMRLKFAPAIKATEAKRASRRVLS